MVIYIDFEGEGSFYYTEEPKPSDTAKNPIPKMENSNLPVPSIGANAGIEGVILISYLPYLPCLPIHEATVLSCYAEVIKNKHLP